MKRFLPWQFSSPRRADRGRCRAAAGTAAAVRRQHYRRKGERQPVGDARRRRQHRRVRDLERSHVVDTKNPGWGQPLLDKIKTVSDKPMTTVINTHTHYDHVSGNVAMPATSRSSRRRTPRR